MNAFMAERIINVSTVLYKCRCCIDKYEIVHGQRVSCVVFLTYVIISSWSTCQVCIYGMSVSACQGVAADKFHEEGFQPDIAEDDLKLHFQEYMEYLKRPPEACIVLKEHVVCVAELAYMNRN